MTAAQQSEFAEVMSTVDVMLSQVLGPCIYLALHTHPKVFGLLACVDG